MKFEHTEVWGFEHAIRGMRNPMNSWDKSDSSWEFVEDPAIINPNDEIKFVMGKNDMDLAQRLIRAGSEHRKFLRQIFVSVDITAPLYWWSEMDTYKVGTVANSTSTMHTIMSKPFTPDLFECEGMRGYKRVVAQIPNKIDEDTEIWVQHPQYKNYYVSSQGRIKHISYMDSHNRLIKERIISGSLHQDGYIFVTIALGDSQYKQIPKHRMVAEAFLPNLKKFPEVNHIDGNKQNNAVENLEWVTSSENSKHAVILSLQPKGLSTYKGKLDKQKRDEIIFRYSMEDISRRELAKQYNVSHTTINALINNRYNYGEGYENEFETFLNTLDELNELRDEWLITKDEEVWKTLIEKLPRNWLQTRTITMDYENLFAMYRQRKSHKLSEWHRDFCNWVDTLPYSDELIKLN